MVVFQVLLEEVERGEFLLVLAWLVARLEPALILHEFLEGCFGVSVLVVHVAIGFVDQECLGEVFERFELVCDDDLLRFVL